MNKLYIKINKDLFKSGQKGLKIRDTDLGQWSAENYRRKTEKKNLKYSTNGLFNVKKIVRLALVIRYIKFKKSKKLH